MTLQDQTLDSSYPDLPDSWSDDINNSLYRADLVNAMTLGLGDTQYYEEHAMATTIDPVLTNHALTHDYRQTPNCEYTSEMDAWRLKPVKAWNSLDIINWINDEARTLGVLCTELAGEKFTSLDGMRLMEFSMADFVSRDKKYGSILYEKLQQFIPEGDRYCNNQIMPIHNGVYENHNFELCDQADISGTRYEMQPSFTTFDLNESPLTTPDFVNLDQTQESKKEAECPPEDKKPRRGRPYTPRRKKKPEKLGRLWEFIRDLLKNREYCPSLIVWDNYEEGQFRFVHSDKVAKLWGTKKDNPDMNYEKLSRAMRYYYKSKVLQPVIGRRLVYKFGPTATNWKVDNPNFKH